MNIEQQAALREMEVPEELWPKLEEAAAHMALIYGLPFDPVGIARSLFTLMSLIQEDAIISVEIVEIEFPFPAPTYPENLN